MRRNLVGLGFLFRWAKARGLVTDNPPDPDREQRLSEPTNRTDYLTEDEERNLLRACPPWLRLIVRFAVNTGMDRSEVHALTTREVDMRAGMIHATRRKTNVSRQNPINSTLREILDEAVKVRQIRPDKPEPAFLGPEGQPIHPEALISAMRCAYTTATIAKRQPWKILRHTFGSCLAMARASAAEIQALMGHSSPATTARYMHLSPEYPRGAIP